MSPFASIARLSFFATVVVIGGCSASPRTSTIEGATEPPTDHDGTGADAGSAPTTPSPGHEPAGATTTWTEVNPDPSFFVGRVYGGRSSVWLVLAQNGQSGGKKTFTTKAGPLASDGSFVGKYSASDLTIVAPTFAISAIAPASDDRAILTGASFFTVVTNGAPIVLGDPSSGYRCAHMTVAGDVWAGAYGRIDHYTGGSSLSQHWLRFSTTPPGKAADDNVNGIWAHGSTLFVTMPYGGLRSIPTPAGDGWNILSEPIVGGDRLMGGIAGTDSTAVAVGYDGFIARYDGTTWTEQTSHVTSELRAVAVPNDTEAWAVGPKAVLHFDGKGWSPITESGAPLGGDSVAVAPDGVVWITYNDKLFRRRVQK